MVCDPSRGTYCGCILSLWGGSGQGRRGVRLDYGAAHPRGLGQQQYTGQGLWAYILFSGIQDPAPGLVAVIEMILYLGIVQEREFSDLLGHCT
ncbi:hypothetical protein FKM82_026631 [Ascaphus truei]